MNEQELEQLKYPIGRFKNPENFTPEFLENCISVIENFPEKLPKRSLFIISLFFTSKGKEETSCATASTISIFD